MINISSWYTYLSDVTFPTSFILLSDEERLALANDLKNAAKDKLWKRMEEVLSHYTGGLTVHADCCAPTDSAAFQKRRIVHTAISSWKQLTTSEKVKNALLEQKTQRIAFRAFRRMDSTREFRIFVRDGLLQGASQYDVKLGFLPKIEAQRDKIWAGMEKFYQERLKGILPLENYVADLYLCSDGKFLVTDINEWGGQTQPLMMRDWNLSGLAYSKSPLILVKKAVAAKGDVQVNF